MKNLPLGLLAVTFVFSASIALADPMSDILAADEAFEADFNNADAAAVAANFTEGAIALSPGWDVVMGRDNIETMYTAFFSAGFHDLNGHSHDIEFVGDNTAIHVHLQDVTRTDKDGASTPHKFKGLKVWRKGDDGAWLVHRTSFNPMPND